MGIKEIFPVALITMHLPSSDPLAQVQAESVQVSAVVLSNSLHVQRQVRIHLYLYLMMIMDRLVSYQPVKFQESS